VTFPEFLVEKGGGEFISGIPVSIFMPPPPLKMLRMHGPWAVESTGTGRYVYLFLRRGFKNR
jgi:hypothetical protein